MKNGVGRKKQVHGLDNEDNYVYELAGATAMGRHQLLAIPMVQEYQSGHDLQLTHVTDPMFTSLLRLPFGNQVGQWQWVYPEVPGLPAGRHEREYVAVPHRGGPEQALNVFYEAVLSDVQTGPDWLHDIALVNFDYLSKNGQGWFHDIEKLTAMISWEDRGKAALVLHAWYDTVGQYSYDPHNKSLMERWTAFPSARTVETQMLGLDPDEGGMPSMALTPGYKWQRASVKALQRVPFSLQEVHRRIHFAKDRGFRVLLYFADGLNACDDSPFFRPDTVLSWGGWEGPDTSGKVYRRNPLHPDVRAFYTGYMSALLREYGTEVDGFVWDETFGIRADAMGTTNYPGYASPAMMSLLKEVTHLVSGYPGLALLASDNLGYENGLQGAPYCLMAHGTYQDSHCRPEAWPYALFPNFRNIVWSCNWASLTNLPFMEFGVNTFDAPVSIGNGAFGDDIGISEMTTQQAQHIIAMFQDRKQRRMQLAYIEENERSGRYGGRSFGNKYNIL